MKLYAIRMDNKGEGTTGNFPSEYYIVERIGDNTSKGEIELEAFMNCGAGGAGLEECRFCIMNTTLDKAIMESAEEVKEFLVGRLLKGYIRVRYH